MIVKFFNYLPLSVLILQLSSECHSLADFLLNKTRLEANESETVHWTIDRLFTAKVRYLDKPNLYSHCKIRWQIYTHSLQCFLPCMFSILCV